MAGTKLVTESLQGFACNTATGGSRLASLEGIQPSTLVDGALAYVRGTNQTFRWNDTSLAAASASVIIPLGQDVLTPGRWLLQSGGGGTSLEPLLGYFQAGSILLPSGGPPVAVTDDNNLTPVTTLASADFEILGGGTDGNRVRCLTAGRWKLEYFAPNLVLANNTGSVPATICGGIIDASLVGTIILGDMPEGFQYFFPSVPASSARTIDQFSFSSIVELEAGDVMCLAFVLLAADQDCSVSYGSSRVYFRATQE